MCMGALLGVVCLIGCVNSGGSKTMHDDVLGTLTWTEATGSWDSSVTLASGVTVHSSLIPLGQDVAPLIEHARIVIAEFVERDRRWRRAAADGLLADYHENWSDGRTISAEEFMDAMSLDGLDFWPDGTAEVSYFDGDLFGGHQIVISFQRDGTIDELNIAG